VDLVCLARLPWLILQPSVASTVIFCEFPHEPLALLPQRFYREKLLAICVKEKIFEHRLLYSLDRNRPENSGYDSFVASNFFSFFGGNPFVDGILGHNLLLSQAISVGIPSWMGF
jgi:hypothetical protein